MTLTYESLMAMPPQSQYNTLECVSNDTDGDLISTAKWTGVKFSDILSQAGVSADATYVVFKATDGYSVGIPMAKAMDPGTILAYQMNGVPLPAEHGYPARMIVPGYYGMMNCKWVTSIKVVAETYQGYWQVRGWINEAQYETGSFIVTPGTAQVADRFGMAGAPNVPLGMVPMAGVAFAGDRGIEKVEVSTDGGNTWNLASLQDPLSGTRGCSGLRTGTPGQGQLLNSRPRYRRDRSGADRFDGNPLPRRGDGIRNRRRGRHVGLTAYSVILRRTASPTNSSTDTIER